MTDQRYAAWRQADEAFQTHRMGCSTCRYNVKQTRPPTLCHEGQRLFDTAEKLREQVVA